MTATHRDQATTSVEVMYMALELSGSKWALTVPLDSSHRECGSSSISGDLTDERGRWLATE